MNIKTVVWSIGVALVLLAGVAMHASAMDRVTVGGIDRVPLQPMNRVPANGINRYQPETQQPVGKSIEEEAQIRAQKIDPQGNGLNQAQINAMEAQRRLMWNSTSPGMVYR